MFHSHSENHAEVTRRHHTCLPTRSFTERFLGIDTSLKCDFALSVDARETVSYSCFDFDILPGFQAAALPDLHAHCIRKASVTLLIASPTQGSVPLLQELHFDDLIDRWSILQFVYESRHQVLVVAREDAQMVAGLVAQSVVVVCVEPHEYGGATVKEMRDLGNNAAPCSVCSI